MYSAVPIQCTNNVPAGREHSPLHNGLGLTPAAAVRLARHHARPIIALGDDQPTLSALYYDSYLVQLAVGVYRCYLFTVGWRGEETAGQTQVGIVSYVSRTTEQR